MDEWIENRGYYGSGFLFGWSKMAKNETKKEIKYVQIVSLTHELYEILLKKFGGFKKKLYLCSQKF